MTALLLLASVVLPTAGSLALLGLADPKRGRTCGAPPKPFRRRRLAAAALILMGLVVGATAGAATLLIWALAVTALGWALTLALADARLRRWARNVAGDRTKRLAQEVVERVARRRGPPQPGALPPAFLVWPTLEAWFRRAATPGRALALLSAACIVTGGVAVLGGVRDAAESARAAVSLQAINLAEGGRADVARIAPCLRTFAIADTAVLRDLLSDRAVSIPVTDPAGAGVDLQRCILAQGGEEVAVAHDPDTGGVTFGVARDVVAAIRAAIVRHLAVREILAELAERDTATRLMFCRIELSPNAPDLNGFVVALGQDRSYSKAEDLLQRIPVLYRLSAAIPPTSLCAF